VAAGTPLIPEQRRQELLRHLRRERVLSFRQITELLGVSSMTARRDVAKLATEGRVRATAGGAAMPVRVLAEPIRSEKAVTDMPLKAAIAKAAAGLVEDSMSVYLDAGTTVHAMVPHLEKITRLTAVTNDLATAQALTHLPGVELICVGGRVDKSNESTLGRLAALTISELSLDVAFLSSSSWDAQIGVTTPVEAKVEVKRAALAHSANAVLLADSAKYGSSAQYRVLDLAELGTVVTDDRLADSDAERVQANGVELLRAEVEPVLDARA